MKTANTFKNSLLTIKNPKMLFRDAFGGVITALISIPISMGYAQIAGLPMVYGLYGSVFPILFFGLLSTSKDFVFGIDAAPAALTGAAIASMGISAESEEAKVAVPTIAFFVACWLLLFYLLRAGKVVQYISEPVMGGFVSGICCTVILMQVPKLYGGTAGAGEGVELVRHIIEQFSHFSPVSLAVGLATITVILISRRLMPKLPMSVFVMAAGVCLTLFCGIESLGVKLLPPVESGFGGFRLPSATLNINNIGDYIFNSLSIAVVIMAESLLASKSNAAKDGYRLQSNREILAYSVANFASAVSGCLPANGSVSRTGLMRQFGVSSQWVSVFASITMLIILFFGTGFIQFLPVPMLTAIIITALMGACEFGIAKRLWKTSRYEFYIFVAAFLGVVLLGTVYGVVIGVILSFVAVVKRAVVPPRSFMGVIPGKNGFYTIGRTSEAKPIKDVVIYRFGGNLFFANIDTFESDIDGALTDSTRVVIINAGAIGSIDLSAADRLSAMWRRYRDRGIRMYLTEHVGEVNDLLRKYGETEMMKKGAVRMTVALALRDAGIRTPYPTEDDDAGAYKKQRARSRVFRRAGRSVYQQFALNNTESPRGIQAELEWAFGNDAEKVKKSITEEILHTIKDSEQSSEALEAAEMMNRWGRFNLFDEDELLDRIELRLTRQLGDDPTLIKNLEDTIEYRRAMIEKRMLDMDPDVLTRLINHRRRMMKEYMAIDRDAAMRLEKRRREHISRIREVSPELAEKYEQLYTDNDEK